MKRKEKQLSYEFHNYPRLWRSQASLSVRPGSRPPNVVACRVQSYLSITPSDRKPSRSNHNVHLQRPRIHETAGVLSELNKR